MTKRRGGDRGGSVENLTVEILKQIRGELSALRSDTNARFGETTAQLVETNARLTELEHATVAGFRHLSDRVDSLGERFDHFLIVAGDRARDHERRIVRIERQLFPRRGG